MVPGQIWCRKGFKMPFFALSRIRSIQLKIALISGACLVVTVAALVGYNLVSTRLSNTYITTEMMGIVDKQVKDTLLNRAQFEAQKIQTELNLGFGAARSLAHVFSVLASNGKDGTLIASRRGQFWRKTRHLMALIPPGSQMRLMETMRPLRVIGIWGRMTQAGSCPIGRVRRMVKSPFNRLLNMTAVKSILTGW